MNESEGIQKMLTEMMVGATIGSLKIAGPELEIFFVGGKVKNASHFSIDTDAWVSVVDSGRKFRSEVVNDKDFFEARKAAIIGLYELTGYDIESVKVDNGGCIQLEAGNKIVLIYPADDSTPEYIEGDSWNVIAKDTSGAKREIVRFDVKQGYIT